MYVAIEGNHVITYATTLAEIYVHILDIRIDLDGKVYIKGKLHSMSYNMLEFSLHEAYAHFYGQYASKHIPKRIGIYKSI